MNARRAKIEQDLLSSLINAEGMQCDWPEGKAIAEDMLRVSEEPQATVAYPWNIATAQWDEHATIFNDLSDQELGQRAPAFFAKLDQVWANTSLNSKISQRFAVEVPTELLNAITERVQDAMQTSRSLADQLVKCVQDVLPNFEEEDLYVLARPFAYAMRSGEDTLEASMQHLRADSWAELSEVEQARLTLAIARSAIAELEEPQA